MSHYGNYYNNRPHQQQSQYPGPPALPPATQPQASGPVHLQRPFTAGATNPEYPVVSFREKLRREGNTIAAQSDMDELEFLRRKQKARDVEEERALYNSQMVSAITDVIRDGGLDLIIQAKVRVEVAKELAKLKASNEMDRASGSRQDIRIGTLRADIGKLAKIQSAKKATAPPPPSDDEEFEAFFNTEGNPDLEHVTGVLVSNGFPIVKAKILAAMDPDGWTLELLNTTVLGQKFLTVSELTNIFSIIKGKAPLKAPKPSIWEPLEDAVLLFLKREAETIDSN
jgi:hypothetical protein